MNRARQLSLIFGTVAIAIGIGHLVQMRAANAELAAAPAPATPTAIVPVSAGPEQPVAQTAAAPAAAPVATPSPIIAGDTAAPEAANVVVADLSPSLPSLPALRPAAAAPTVTAPAPSGALTTPAAPAPESPIPALVTPDPAIADTPVPALVAPATAAPATVAENACLPSLRLAAAPHAMIGVSLVAPCAPQTRVVIGHAGLAITGKTDAAGSLFLSLPALAVDARISARLPDGTTIDQQVRVPAMATLRRMGVQWQDDDAFQLHAFENGAGYGDAGHIWADAPQTPKTGLAAGGAGGIPAGFITVLGDADVDMPMRAEIYTFPAGLATNAEIVIESAVTEATCGRELLGETLMTLAGETFVSELTLAMPDCDAVGDILVLKNLVTDLTIAAAN